MTTLKQKILQLDFESSFPKPKKAGVAMRRWLSAQHQWLEICDFIKNPQLYFEKDVQRARRIGNMFGRAIAFLTRKPKRFRRYAISLGLQKYFYRGKTANAHYCLFITSDFKEKAAEFRVSLATTAPTEEYTD